MGTTMSMVIISLNKKVKNYTVITYSLFVKHQLHSTQIISFLQFSFYDTNQYFLNIR